jgi:predicted nucleotidyltransferase
MTERFFAREQLEALSALSRLWSSEQFVLIGASALGCFMDMRWRQTYDLDLCVSLSMETYSEGLDLLPGWNRHPKLEHRWVAPGSVTIDIVPAVAAATGELVWPESGFRMSVVGLRLAFDHFRVLPLAVDLEVKVALVQAIAVMKMVAYLDRPIEREKDLADLCFIFEGFLSETDERRFADEVFTQGLHYEETSAYYLGKEINLIVNPAERDAVSKFVTTVSDENGSSRALGRMAQLGPVGWQRDPDIVLNRLNAFDRGFHT